MCFQGSHDCDNIKTLQTTLSSASISLSAGHVWLCGACLSSSSPIKQRRSKSRHNSASKTASTLQRIRDELQDQSIQFPTESPLITPGNNTPTCTSEVSNDHSLNRDLQSDLAERLQQVSNERVCPRYKSGKCPHRLRGNKMVEGNKCELNHPKRCTKFCKFGSKHRHGCNKGGNCDYYHPTICKFTLQSRLCTNKECTFVHLKGTKRKDGPDSLLNSRP